MCVALERLVSSSAVVVAVPLLAHCESHSHHDLLLPVLLHLRLVAPLLSFRRLLSLA